MVDIRDVKMMKSKIEKFKDPDDEEKILAVLRNLKETNMTVPILIETKIGMEVNRLKKKTSNKEISSLATELVKQWKIVAEAAGIKRAEPDESKKRKNPSENENVRHSKPRKVGDSDSTTDNFSATQVVKTNKISKTEALATQKPKNVQAEVEFDEPIMKQEESDDFKSSSLSGSVDDEAEAQAHPHRSKMRDIFSKEFSKPEKNDFFTVSLEDATSAAASIEKEINAIYPVDEQKTEYNQKVRTLLYNLRNNAELREEVLTNRLPHNRLVAMSSAELLSSVQRKTVEAAAKNIAEARRLDWAEKNQDLLNKQCGIKKNEGMFECSRCKSTKTTYTQKQTRSADEPMTTFVTCQNCKKKWKFC